MSFLENVDIDALLKQTIDLLQGTSKPTQPNTVNTHTDNLSASNNTKIQAPIKGEFKNSGGFTPGNVVLNERHQHGHQGVDMRAPGGTPVYPMAAGIVTDIGSGGKGGNFIHIDHGNGMKTYYAHLGTINIKAKDKVDNNTVIGTVGASGNAADTYPHLHFTVSVNGVLKDPATFFNVPKYTDLSPEEKKIQWLSPAAKQQADNFRFPPPKTASKIDNILKLSKDYYNLCIK